MITQNIDGLHQRAGFPAAHMIEIHGNGTHGRCLECRTPMALEEVRAQIDETGAAPRCSCGGLVKAAVISFGQSLEPAALARAGQWSAAADLFLVLGSSLQVRPAASLPEVAKARGAQLAIVNREPTPLDDLADLVLALPIGNAFTQLYPQLRNQAMPPQD